MPADADGAVDDDGSVRNLGQAVTKDGRTLRGRRLNEDTYSVQIIDEQENLLSLKKADLREVTVATTAAMPSYADRLTPDELADLVAYLVSLKGL